MGYKYHKYADVFPLLEGEAFVELCADIEQNGQREPIILYDGAILDGRNRYRACVELNIPPQYEHSSATNDAEALKESVSRNLHRRHLSSSQRALVAAELMPMFEEMAKERQIQSGVDHGRGGIKVEANLPQPLSERSPQARDQAAELTNSSARSIQSAKSVLNNGTEKLVDAVRSGDIAVSKAEEVSRLPADKQDEIVGRVENGEKAADVVREVTGGTPKALQMSNSNEWYTPAGYVESARRVMGAIELDPASCEQANEVVKAANYYTKDQDGYAQEWSGRVWMNPPYGREEGKSNQGRWTKKLIESYEAGDVQEAVFLVNAFTSASWFGLFWDYPICFVGRRIRFCTADGVKQSPTHGNVIVYLGFNVAGFIDEFGQYGMIVVPVPQLKNVSAVTGGE